ncbi:MAG: GNAT family N-acetyltransferase [Bacteroidota bacterium]
MADIIIRRAGEEDAGLIADLSRQTFYDSFAAANIKEDMDRFMKEQFSRDALIKEVKTGNGIFFLAYDEGEAIGYVRMRDGEYYPEFGNSSFIEIARIYAVQSSIGKGVGSALIKKCIETAKELNRDIIWLGVWEHNKRAIDFYTKFGFEKFGQHDFVLGTDIQTDWLMKKNL